VLGLTAACHNSIVYCNEIICNHRIHNTNATVKYNNENSVKRTTRLDVLIATLKLRKQWRKRVEINFLATYKFISQTKVESKETKEAKKIALLMSDPSFIPTLKAIVFCISHRNTLIKEESNGLKKLLKASFFPFQTYHYYNY
jgi:hypothetical protein